MAISDGIPAVLRNSKLSEFNSEPFYGRENYSEFRSVEQNRRNSRISILNLPRKRKTRIPFRGTKSKELSEFRLDHSAKDFPSGPNPGHQGLHCTILSYAAFN